MSGRYIKKAEAHLFPESYALQQERTKRYRTANRDLLRARQRARRNANLEKERARQRNCEHRRRLKRYGVTQEQVDEMFRIQNACCGICSSKECGGKRTWHIDHCHSTGKVRGILCHHCNLLLGNAKDNRMVLHSAIKYLENFL